ncbi:hypothetical protein RHECNPAF_3340051 [Rhizobium etli CNPAF512]|nr:hypothetical protein RHECNPAF_3340051 [Rhizobium etli CNPAF512]
MQAFAVNKSLRNMVNNSSIRLFEYLTFTLAASRNRACARPRRSPPKSPDHQWSQAFSKVCRRQFSAWCRAGSCPIASSAIGSR